MQDQPGRASDAGVSSPADEPQPSVEQKNPASEPQQVLDMEREMAMMQKIHEVDTIAQRERERIEKAQIETYGETVHRTDEPLYGLTPIEGGAHEVPKEEEGPRGVPELNLTWAIVFGGLLVFAVFVAVLFISVYNGHSGPWWDNWEIVKSPLSVPPHR